MNFDASLDCSLCAISVSRSGTKLVVGTQLGILSIFDPKKGFGDSVDRVKGSVQGLLCFKSLPSHLHMLFFNCRHPQSIDALCALPDALPDSHSTILTGSSDGLVRAVQVLPTKLIGVVVDHGECPVERIRIDRGGQGNWVGSIGHDEHLKLTDLRGIFEYTSHNDSEEGDEDDGSSAEGTDVSDAAGDQGDVEQGSNSVAGTSGKGDDASGTNHGPDELCSKHDERSESSDEEADAELERIKKRKRKQAADPLASSRSKKGRNQITVNDSGFFAGL
jgi:hypothetical protein